MIFINFILTFLSKNVKIKLQNKKKGEIFMRYYSTYDISQYARSSDVSDFAMATTIGALGVFFMFILLFSLCMIIIEIIAMWKIFTKAGEKGWKAIIPIYSTVILFKISGISPWLLLLLLLGFIPIVGWLIAFGLSIYLANSLSKSFGKDIGYTIGLIFLPFIFHLILGFGKAEYVGPGGKQEITEINQ